MKKVLSLLLVICLSLSMCFALASCDDKENTDTVETGENNDSESESLTDTVESQVSGTLKNYDITQWRAFLIDYEAFIDAYVLVQNEELSASETMQWSADFTHYLAQGTAISEAFLAQIENGSYEYLEEMTEFSTEFSRISEKLPSTETETE